LLEVKVGKIVVSLLADGLWFMANRKN